MSRVFVVILNWNGKGDTLECLRTLREMSIPPSVNLEVVVIDNASKDDSVEAISRFKTKKFKVSIFENEQNYGFAKGNNVGIRYAVVSHGDYVMILNNDTLVHKDLLVKLLEFMNGKPKAGVVSPKIYFAPRYEYHSERYNDKDLGKVIWYAGGKIDWRNVYGVNAGIDEVDGGDFSRAEEVDFATGACSFFRIKSLLSVRGYDERYFMYMEDVDMSVRLKRAGWQIWYEPKGIVWHKVSRSSGIGGALSDYFLSRNRLLFGMSYARARTKIAMHREGIRLLFLGRTWQKIGVRDYYLRKFDKGSWKS